MAPTGTGVVFQYGAGKGKGLDKAGHRLLNQPRGLHVDSDGALYVADFTNFCVVRFARDDHRGHVVVGEEGKQLLDVDHLKDIDRPLAPPEGEGFLLKNPVDVARNSDGLVVLDCAAARAQLFQPGQQGQASGAGKVVVPPPAVAPVKSVAAPEALKHPRSVLCQDDGSLVVCDTWSHRILRFSGASVEVLAGVPNSCGSEAEKLSFPSCVAFCHDGSFLVSDTNNHRIQRFWPGNGKGQTVAGSADCKAGDSLSHLNMPTGLAVEGDSFLVADRANGRLLRFKLAGGPGELVCGSELLERPWGVALDKDGSIFVSDERKGVVLKLADAARQRGPAVSGGYPTAPKCSPAKSLPVAPETPVQDNGLGLD